MDFSKNSKNNKRPVWLFGLLTGLLFLAVGAAQGQFSVILKKAVMICLECIGIG